MDTPTINNAVLRKSLIGAATALWVIALLVPAYCDTPGFVCFLFGWLRIGTEFFSFLGWLGNLLAGIAWIMIIAGTSIKSATRGMVLAFIATVLSLFAFFDADVPGENIKSGRLCSATYGVYIWFLSVVAVFAVAVVNYLQKEQKK